MQKSQDIQRLIDIMAALRTPVSGCPWDLDQDLASLARYALEEAYEVVDAIERDDMLDLRDELGDLLLQVVFQARLAEESGRFAFGDVVEAITGKLIRRHPHIFGEARDLSPDGVKALWDQIKAAEKAERAAERGEAETPRPGALEGVPMNLPALTWATKLQRKAAGVGFDWAAIGPVLAKIREELDEVEAALADGDEAALAAEIGDVVFAVANLARHKNIDPETALRATNAKFERRFAFVEAGLAQIGRTPHDSTLAEMDRFWDEAKAQERAAASTSGKRP